MPRWERLTAAVGSTFVYGVFQTIRSAQGDNSRFGQIDEPGSVFVPDSHPPGRGAHHELENIAACFDAVSGIRPAGNR